MGNFYEYHAERGCDNPDCQECSGEAPPSIDSIIENAVASGVEQGLVAVLKKYDLVEKPKKPNTRTKKVMQNTDQGLNLTEHDSVDTLCEALKI